MNEGRLHSRKLAQLHGSPASVERRLDDARAEVAHPLHFRLRRCLDSQDAARNPRLARGEGHSLSGVAGTDGPYALLSRFRREEGHGVCSAADLEGIDRLQILQLEPDLRHRRIVAQLDQRRSDGHVADALARGANFFQGYGANGRGSDRHKRAL